MNYNFDQILTNPAPKETSKILEKVIDILE